MAMPKKPVKPPTREPDQAPQPATDIDPVTVYNLEPNEPFLLRHFHQNWEVATVPGKGVFLLPDIDRQPILPGVGLIRTTKKGEQPPEAYRRERAERETEGWKYLLNNAAPDQGGGYLRKVACSGQNGAGTFYTDPWTSIKHDKNPKRRAHLTFNRDAYDLWRYELVANGVIPGPDEDIKQKHIDRSKRHGRRATADFRLPEQTRKILEERAAARVADAEKAGVPGEVASAA